MEIYSIGFTQKNAGEFFETLKAHGIERLLDVRLNNTSQLAGFAKQADLAYFLKAICGAAYEHEPLLAPTQEMLDTYKKKKGDWNVYTEEYLDLIRSRKVESALSQRELREADGASVQRGHCRALSSAAGARIPAKITGAISSSIISERNDVEGSTLHEARPHCLPCEFLQARQSLCGGNQPCHKEVGASHREEGSALPDAERSSMQRWQGGFAAGCVRGRGGGRLRVPLSSRRCAYSRKSLAPGQAFR